MALEETSAAAGGTGDTARDVTIVRDATCTFCSCVCDDIDLTVQDQQIVAAERACLLGQNWFLRQRNEPRPVCLIHGRPATVEEGIEKAAEILREAKYPLVYGMSETTTETQRVAVGIADWIGGIVDTPTSGCQGPTGMNLHGVGEVTSSLGEVQNRGDLIIFWGTDPAASHPRHFSKYSLEPKGLFLPNGRSDRTCVVVDVQRTESADEADVFLQIKPGGDFEAIWILRALAAGIEVDPEQSERDTGLPLSAWRDLIIRMKAAKFGVLFYGLGITTTRSRHLNAEALLALTRDMNQFTRFVCKANRSHSNLAGADNVLTWRTGFPFSVSLAPGYPRFNPGEYSAEAVLARKEADAALIIASDPLTDIAPAAREHLASIPYIAVDFRDTPTMRGAAVAFHTATYGIHVPGTVYRLDDVPIPLRPALESPLPSDWEILRRIEQRVTNP